MFILKNKIISLFQNYCTIVIRVIICVWGYTITYIIQKWRDFLWKTTPKFNDTISYITEKGITISGKVKQLLGEKALINNNMTLALMNKKNFNIFNAATDSIGAFKFENLNTKLQQ